MKPARTITENYKTGIYENATRYANVYADKIIVHTDYVRWIGNTGTLAEHVQSIRDPEIIRVINNEIVDGCECTAWQMIDKVLSRD